MSVASSTTSSLDRACMITGTAMMLAWILQIGIVGLALLLAIAYGLTFHHPTFAIVCAFLLFAPLILTVLWGILGAAAAIREIWATYDTVSGLSWWERRQAHRILYQAYFL